MDLTSFTFFRIFVFFCLIVNIHSGNVTFNRICLDQDSRDACQQIGRDNQIICQSLKSKIDCLLSADRGDPVLSIITAEEALLGAALTNLNTVVIGEATRDSYETVVLIRNGLNINSGLKYCHPGYDHDELVTSYVLEELDRTRTTYSCNSSLTLVEQKFEALANEFGPSCRPGQWSEDDNLDAQLKARYPTLCELCTDYNCNSRYTVPFKETLDCLTKVGGGDFALTTAQYASEFFSSERNVASFRYWCRDGTISSSQCIWTNQTRRVLITSSSSAGSMQDYLRGQLGGYLVDGTGSGNVASSLARVFELSSSDRIRLINPIGLSQYVLAHRAVPSINDSIQCNLTVSWSVTDNVELNKCLWLQQAAVNVGVQPVLTCAQSQSNDTVSNLDNISNQVADVAFIEASWGYIARRKNLTNIAYLETERRQLSRVALVIRNDTTWFTGSFDSLRGKSVCLPEYGGKEWLVLIDTLIRSGVFEASCDYGGLLSNFVGDSCAPGALDSNLNIPNTNDVVFCSRCIPFAVTGTARYCNGDAGNKFYGSDGALRCLESGSGDYAVISLNDLPHFHGFNLDGQFRGVAANGSIADLTRFYNDDDAPLAVITAGEVLIRRNNTKFNDVVLLLRSIEHDFGQNLEKAFKVFEQFNRTADLIFPDSTPGISISGGGNRYVTRFQDLLRNPESCATTGEPITPTPSKAYHNVPVMSFLVCLICSFFF